MDAHRSRGPKRRRSPRIEALEIRDVPATFGVPWADAGHLTISFAPDGTRIAGESSSLFQALDAQMPTSAWQGEILRAFQSWAGKTGVNLSLVPDDGSPFGVAGQTQHDPRFGDIRIGAHAMAADALAISVPNDPAMTGTLTGDLLLNTSDLFDPAHLDLFTVALHEAGHVFGLAESTDAKSPMFASYAGNSALTSGDVKNIQSLYGARPADLNEGSAGNATIAKAATIQAPSSYDGATPLVAFGDIAGPNDVDIYAFRSPFSGSQGDGGATIRLQTDGISLLAPRLSVLDSRGNVVAEAQAGGTSGGTVTLHIDRVTPNGTYYLKVQGATRDEFGFGHYGLAASFDRTSTTPVATLEAVLRRDGQSLSPNDIDSLFRDPSGLLLNNDRHSDDAVGTATILAPDPNFARETHYETVGSISDATDVDFYRIKSYKSSGQANVLTVRIRAIAPNGVAPRATILDSDGNVVPSTILANGDGQFTIQAVGFKGGGNLILRVAGTAGSPATGNYGLAADFGGPAAAMAAFGGGTLSSQAPIGTADLYVGRSQLFQFLLAADAPGIVAAPGTGLEMTILDASGHPVFRLFTADGDVAGASSVLLTPGAYTIRYAVVSADGTEIPALTFNLSGATISDPIGPAIKDPTLTPTYTNPTTPGTYLYPKVPITTAPYYIGTVLV